MPYATVDDVGNRVPFARVGEDRSKWTEAEINRMIEEADAAIDGALAEGRVDPERLPLVPGSYDADAERGTTGYRRVMLMVSVAARLRAISAGLVAARIFRALPGGDTDTRAGDVLLGAQRDLAAIRARPGAVVRSEAILARPVTVIESDDEGDE